MFTQLKQVLKMGDLNRLHVSVFTLHLLLTAMFIYVPSQLIQFADIPLRASWLGVFAIVVGQSVRGISKHCFGRKISQNAWHFPDRDCRYYFRAVGADFRV